jgi:hypothetical protein
MSFWFLSVGGCHDESDAEWTVIREPLGVITDRNFPCQTLKIRKVFLVVMGS